MRKLNRNRFLITHFLTILAILNHDLPMPRCFTAFAFLCATPVWLLCAVDSLTLQDLNKYVLYHFIRQTAYVSQNVDILDRKDGSGVALRRAFSSTVGLSDANAVSVFAIAKDLDA